MTTIPQLRAELDEKCHWYQQAYERYGIRALRELEEEMRKNIEAIQTAWREGEED